MTITEMEALVNIFEDKREIKNLMGKYAASLVIRRDADMFIDFWAKDRCDVSLGFNGGYYLGRESIENYYNYVVSKYTASSAILKSIFPEQLGSLSPKELYGVGTLEMKPLQSCVLCVAKDRKTAKGLWAVNGNSAEVTTAGPTARWTWGYFAGDFIFEEDQWKIWHLLYLEDINVQAGQDWSAPAESWPDREEFLSLKDCIPPAFDKKAPLRELYSPDRVFTKTPEIPVPYNTFSETFSYGA